MSYESLHPVTRDELVRNLRTARHAIEHGITVLARLRLHLAEDVVLSDDVDNATRDLLLAHDGVRAELINLDGLEEVV